MFVSATPSRNAFVAVPRALYRALGAAEEAIAMVLLVGIVAVVTLQVVGRYLLPNPFIWPEEVTRLMLVWLTFIGGAAVTRHGAHIAVDLVLDLMPDASRRLMGVLINLVTGAVFVFVALLAAKLAGNVATLPLAATRWSMAVMVWPAAVGCGLIALHAFVRAAAGVRRP